MSNSILYTESEEDQDQILLPICTLFPPNEIITKNYAPDVKPAIKLLPTQKTEKKRVMIQNEKHHSYWDIFTEYDTLGFQYVSLLRTKLVYLKFNSIHYMKPALKGRQHKYLAGMFIPLQKLLSQNVKKYRNVYKTLANLQFIENKLPVQTSFGTNCYSSAPDLRFSSNYESSNLFAAIKIDECEYDLILQNDTNSRGNTQWFNFTVEISEEKNYKFNIVNLTKSSSLYQKGMSIAYYSQATKTNTKMGWTKGCHSISYKSNSISREDNQNYSYYSLHFQYGSPYKNDVVTFSYSFPYTSLDLQKFFNKVMLKRLANALKIQKIKIAETLTGFPIFVYMFSHKKHLGKRNFSSSHSLLEGNQQGAPSVIFMARQHPGESQGSYIAQGLVQWILQGDFQSWKKSYQFYVIPMVNTDGVFYGNYRTNLSGNDLNRIWRQPRKDYHCQIYFIKKFFFSLNKLNPISLIIDIHGHSNSLNSFFYGNPPKKQSQNTRIFPYYCSKKIKQISFTQSTFSVSEDKKTCARVVLSEMFPKALVYTFQNTFYGWKKGKVIIQHTIQSYRKLGRDLAECFVEYSRLIDKNPDLKQKWAKEIDQIYRHYSKEQHQQVVSQSDSEAERELIQFPELSFDLGKQPSEANLNSSNGGQSKKTPSIGKRRLLKYIKKHSPVKLKSNYPNQAYFTQKQPEYVASQSQGFLSIIKINTRPCIDSSNTLQNLRKKSTKRKKSIKLRLKQDLVIEQSSIDQPKQKENNDRFVKVSKLIGEKEYVLERQRQARIKLQQNLIHGKSCNGFFRYNYIKKS